MRINKKYFSGLPVHQLLCDKQVAGGGGPVLQPQQDDQVTLSSYWSTLLILCSHWSSHDSLNASKLGYHVAHSMDLYDEVNSEKNLVPHLFPAMGYKKDFSFLL